MGSKLSNLVYHVIFSTKGREQFIMPEIRNELHQYMGGIIKGEGVFYSKPAVLPIISILSSG